jgi:hypothetical protein
MKNTRITRNEAVQIIRSGKFCNVVFSKRSDDSRRSMTCRSGVKRHLKGGDKPYEPKEHQLITVYEVNSKENGYKAIPVERILWVNGKQVV